jgi:hypothetical protein
VLSGTGREPWQLLFPAGNSTATTFGSVSPTTTIPSGGGVFTMPGTGEEPNDVKFLFFGGPSGNPTFAFRVIGWNPTAPLTLGGSDSVPLWIPDELCAGTGTVGTMPGNASFSAPSSSSFTTGLTITNGNQNVDVKVHNPGDNLPASLSIDMEGSQMGQLQIMSADSASMNAFWRPY